MCTGRGAHVARILSTKPNGRLRGSSDRAKSIDFSSDSVRSQFFDDLAYLRTNYYERYPNHFTIDGKAMLYLYLVRNFPL